MTTPPAVNCYWVTVRHAPGRTQDHRIMAPTQWSAGWLWRHLNPCDQDVVCVREVKRYGHQG